MRTSVIAVMSVFSISIPIYAQSGPTSLVCRSNGKTWRDYSFTGKRWEGRGRDAFATAILGATVEGFPLRDKVFSGLNTSKPVIRSITPSQGGLPEAAAEFDGRVVLRTSDEVFVTWTNDINKMWLAVIDLRNKTATVAQTFAGITSTGGELETLDCR
jgi:hypothetical protein